MRYFKRKSVKYFGMSNSFAHKDFSLPGCCRASPSWYCKAWKRWRGRGGFSRQAPPLRIEHLLVVGAQLWQKPQNKRCQPFRGRCWSLIGEIKISMSKLLRPSNLTSCQLLPLSRLRFPTDVGDTYINSKVKQLRMLILPKIVVTEFSTDSSSN